VVRCQAYQRHTLAAKYTAEDIALLAEVDRAHGRLSGPATRRILQRAYEQFGEKPYERLAKISVAHLFNLRASARYHNRAAVFEPTQSTAAAIGQRRKPDPQGRPGYVRVDTVHQGDSAGTKGVYHINAVDAVTQWQVVGCAEKISEAYLVPVLAAVLAQFPFPIRGFHADNGSAYINHRVAAMLRKPDAEFTKSQACRSQDDALVGRQERCGDPPTGRSGAVLKPELSLPELEKRVRAISDTECARRMSGPRPSCFANARRRRCRSSANGGPWKCRDHLPHAR